MTAQPTTVGSGRTKLHQPKVCKRDWHAVGVFVVLVLAVVTMNLVF